VFLPLKYDIWWQVSMIFLKIKLPWTLHFCITVPLVMIYGGTAFPKIICGKAFPSTTSLLVQAVRLETVAYSVNL